MTYLRLVWVFFRIGTLSELQYRVNFIVQLLQSLMSLLTGLAGLGVVFAHTRTLGGWGRYELLVVLGVYFLVGGAIDVVIRPSMQRFMEDVRQGTLDFALTKPIDAQLLVSIRQWQAWKFIDMGLGVGVLLLALRGLTGRVGLLEGVEFTLVLLVGCTIVYSFWMILATLSFWFVRVDNILVIFLSLYAAGRWPVTIYPRLMRYLLTFLVPVAFAVTVPAQALTGQLSWQLLLEAFALAAALLVVSRWFWLFGVQRYTGASA